MTLKSHVPLLLSGILLHRHLGDFSFWVPMSLLSLQVREHLVRQYEKRVAAGYEWTEGEVEWTPRNTIVYPLICSMAGAALVLCYLPPWHACH